MVSPAVAAAICSFACLSQDTCGNPEEAHAEYLHLKLLSTGVASYQAPANKAAIRIFQKSITYTFLLDL